MGAQDGTNAQRTGGLDTNLKDGVLGRKGGLGPGGLGREGPRLSAADLAKLVGAGSYDSPMPTTQTAPNLPQLPSIPTQALTAPTQSMLGSAGAISPLLNELLQRAATNPLGDGAPHRRRWVRPCPVKVAAFRNWSAPRWVFPTRGAAATWVVPPGVSPTGRPG